MEGVCELYTQLLQRLWALPENESGLFLLLDICRLPDQKLQKKIIVSGL